MSKRMVYVECPTCHQPRKIRAADVKRIKQCRQCHLTQIASKGWEATCAKYGPHVAVRCLRDYRLANPSSLEQIVCNWLDCQHVCYEREYWFQTEERVFLVDFLVSGNIAVEVNGDYVHSLHPERDALKIASLQESGFKVEVLSEKEVLTGAFVHRLASALR